MWRKAPALPIPLTNNAVAASESNGECTIYSAMGMDQTLAPGGLVNHAYQWHVGAERWQVMPNPPTDVGRMAASAVTMRSKLYVLGGYTVDSDGTELSFGAVHAFDIAAAGWSTIEPIPVYVHDQVALAWRNRWIVTVGGRSDTGPVDAVQLFDAETGTWAEGTAFPGTPVFGHAGALVGDQLVIIDGVTHSPDGPEIVEQAWLATLDPENPTEIAWEDLGGHPGPARYRAAAGYAWGENVWFHGGTDEPYDFDGLTYAAGIPATPLPTTLVFDFGTGTFSLHDKLKPVATMDHRGLASCGGRMYTVGGLEEGPEVTSDVWVYTY